ncbi:hypothetical protein U3A55_02005 [Salarchaeum sp. III]|uniref:hypothetical protein n=1 Tax=Salarchaeum sp. III TaxID=3107927 RepID=UPI002ED9522D
MASQVHAAPEVTRSVTAPTDDLRGLGSRQSSDGSLQFFSTHPPSGRTATGEQPAFDWYYFNPAGAVSSSGSTGVYSSRSGLGAAINSQAAYVTVEETIKRYAGGEESEADLPAVLHSLAYDDTAGQLWAGAGNGRVWQLDSELSIERSYSLNDRVSGLAHDGEFFWVKLLSNPNLYRIPPAEPDAYTGFESPVDQDIYDLTYLDDRLWVATDQRVYETTLSQSSTNESTSTTTTESTTADAPTTTRAQTTTEAQTTEARTTNVRTTEAPTTETRTTEARTAETTTGTGSATGTQNAESTRTDSSMPDGSASGSTPGFGPLVALGGVLGGLWRLMADDSGE